MPRNNGWLRREERQRKAAKRLEEWESLTSEEKIQRMHENHKKLLKQQEIPFLVQKQTNNIVLQSVYNSTK